MPEQIKHCSECGTEIKNGLYDDICDHCAALEDEWGGGCDQD